MSLVVSVYDVNIMGLNSWDFFSVSLIKGVIGISVMVDTSSVYFL